MEKFHSFRPNVAYEVSLPAAAIIKHLEELDANQEGELINVSVDKLKYEFSYLSNHLIEKTIQELTDKKILIKYLDTETFYKINYKELLRIERGKE